MSRVPTNWSFTSKVYAEPGYRSETEPPELLRSLGCPWLVPTGWSVRSVSLAWHLCHQFWCWPDQRFGCEHATVGIALSRVCFGSDSRRSFATQRNDAMCQSRLQEPRS